VREQMQQRWALPRQQQTHQTPWGTVQIKSSSRPDGSLLRKPELEELRALADRLQMPLPELRRRMLSWLEQEEQL
jgi:uncharacterized protein (DUF111 family)